MPRADRGLDCATDQAARPLGSARASACRLCGAELRHLFVDLGMTPLCQTHIDPDRLDEPEPYYPLRAYVCGRCFLVQLKAYVTPGELFGDYAYLSSYAESWVRHAARYVESITQRLALGPGSFVVEVASNDGYLLRHFRARDIPVLGVEPAANVARAAERQGIDTLVAFFGAETARRVLARSGAADLIVANNVLAHVPDLHDFAAGMKILLKEGGTLTLEFPHLVRLMEENQFDTIYHEHFSYFSLLTAEQILAAHGLRLFDLEELPTHGGSLRLYACHAQETDREAGPRVAALSEREAAAHLTELEAYQGFARRVARTKRRLLSVLIAAKAEGRSIAGYGAPGKGNTLLNYCGIGTDFLDYTVDRNPHKQGKYTPGMRIPILDPKRIKETKPDYVLILPWNLKDEIMDAHGYIRDWGGRFIVPIPEVAVLP